MTISTAYVYAATVTQVHDGDTFTAAAAWRGTGPRPTPPWPNPQETP